MSARTRNRLLMAVVWLFLLLLFLPVLVVIPVSVTDKSYLSLPADGISFEHYGSLTDPAKGWVPSFRNSALAAIATAIMATGIAAAFAVGAWIRSGWWPSAVRLLMLSPLIVPPIIYAVGMVRVLSKVSMLDTFWGVLVVHVVLSLPMAFLAIAASLANLDNRMVTAARSLGARPITIFGRVILPNIAPGLAAGAFLAFITSWDEITVTLFITARHFVTLPRRIYTSITDSIDPALAAIAAVLLIATMAVLIAQTLLKGRGARAGSAK
ncbi:ABC transporter permease subunit [Pseudaminobacter sp. 19-2017]|uniref:ABC transporter permease subunit n=1 Tax=Pseudaminobacter soli (ex Zhang et al. 2022) TaxID=2831468 RepID=A0A942E735_9HYPH|nr:ABC transporter permease subunit [Pseudaminobacter soli]MBS3652136.1 ABC transporter permease subunit [Pseudaminobacter soli]